MAKIQEKGKIPNNDIIDEHNFPLMFFRMHVLSAIIIAMDCKHHDSDSRPFNLSLSFYKKK